MTDESPAPKMPEGTPLSPEVARFIGAWSESMASVLGSIAGSAYPVRCVNQPDSSSPSPSESDLEAVVTASGPLRGEMNLHIPQSAVIRLAQVFLGEETDTSVAFKAEHRDAVEELIRQIAGHVASALKPVWGDCQLRVEFGVAPAWPPGAEGWFTSSNDSPSRLWVQWRVSAALVAALNAARSSRTPSEGSVPASGIPGAPRTDGQNLDLLMDVELEITLRFGQRTMLLREVLELGAGSVIELDRHVDEPVDLLLDNRLIARGDVVVVDGDYGLKVLEVMSPRPACVQPQ